MIKSKFGQRIVGLFVLVLGGWCTASSWHTVLTEGHYERNAVIFFPALAIFGLGMLLFPIDVDRLRAEHGVEKLHSWAHYPLPWKVLFVAAFVAALGNWWAISHL